MARNCPNPKIPHSDNEIHGQHVSNITSEKDGGKGIRKQRIMTLKKELREADFEETVKQSGGEVRVVTSTESDAGVRLEPTLFTHGQWDDRQGFGRY